MSKYATTEYNRQLRVQNKIRDVYSRAIAYRFSADKLGDEITTVWAMADYQKLSAYARGYCRGMADMLNADIWNNHVVWMLGPSTGPTRQVHTEWTEEMSTLCRLPGQLYGGHFWTDDKGKPTDKVFTEYKATN